MKNVALITGVTGQDGAYLAVFLLKRGYEVHGVQRLTSLPNTDRIQHLKSHSDNNKQDLGLLLHDGDMTDSSSLREIVKSVKPDENYNLAAQSDVGISFDQPECTANINALVRSDSLKQLEALALKIRPDFTKPQLLNYSVGLFKHRKMKKLLFTRDHLMLWQNFTPIGLRLITARLTVSMLAMGFYLIMNPPCGVRVLLHER